MEIKEVEFLKNLGLTESEIRVYFALLELESSTVGEIYKKAGVADSKIYLILEKLKEKGLVSFVVKNNVKHFQATEPKNLLRFLEEKELEIEEQKFELTSKIIPEIMSRRKLSQEKSQAVVYEGFEGLKSAFNFLLGSLEKEEEYQVFMLGEILQDKKVINFFENFHKKRIEKGIKTRLVSELKFREVVTKKHKYAGMKIRFTNRKLPVGMFIFKDCVMNVIFEDKPIAFLIKSGKNYRYFKEFFEDVWKAVKD